LLLLLRKDCMFYLCTVITVGSSLHMLLLHVSIFSFPASTRRQRLRCDTSKVLHMLR
jgi:hypothetical protein